MDNKEKNNLLRKLPSVDEIIDQFRHLMINAPYTLYVDNIRNILKDVRIEVENGKNIENIKNRVVRQEKEKKLQMFSKSHYSKLEKTIQISFL